jgi:hypothetical protein
MTGDLRLHPVVAELVDEATLKSLKSQQTEPISE